jgi:DNA-binding phage protein
MSRKKKKTVYYDLEDSHDAAAYLSGCLNNSIEEFLLALREVVKVNGGFSALARETNMDRSNFYHMLSEAGNPTLNSLSLIFDFIGLEFNIAARE